MSITVDDDAYPFLVQAFPRGRKSEASIAGLFARMNAIGERAIRESTRHVVIAVGDEDFTAAERRLVAEHMANADPEVAACIAGAFAVVESTVARGVLTALHWLAPKSIPVVAAATPDEAVGLAERRLIEVGAQPSLAAVARAKLIARRLHGDARQPRSLMPPRL
jgi:hypothetical protein